jgi:flagellin-specific chaperone FliS
VFLEDLSTTSKQIKSPLNKAKEVIEELRFFMEKCGEKSRELASLFDSLASGYNILEKNKTQEMNSIDIKIG